jgi:hypothetical protein
VVIVGKRPASADRHQTLVTDAGQDHLFSMSPPHTDVGRPRDQVPGPPTRTKPDS